MIEPIQAIKPTQPVQPVEATQPIQSSIPVGYTSPKIDKKTPSNVKQNINIEVNNNIGVQDKSEDKGKFILGSDARLEQLKSIYTEKTLKQMGIMECTTCNERRYVDVSNDPGVSFKTPTNISPEQSFSAVAAHESEHVANEKFNAIKENGEMLYQSVVLHTAICPECGIAYTSGGTTTSVMKKPGRQSITTGQLVDLRL